MRAVVRVFLTFPTKSIGGSSTYKKLPFHICTKKSFPKFEIIRVKNTGVMN